MSRCNSWKLLIWVALALGALAAFGLPTTNTVNEVIPPLRPPRPEMPPDYWEQNGFWVVTGCVVVLTLSVATALLVLRPRRVVEPEPAARARRELEPLSATEETGPVLSRISQVVKEYFRDTFSLPRQEQTTAEFCGVVAANQRVGPELACGISDFLRRCDMRKFALRPPADGSGAAVEALKLVQAGELRRGALEQQAGEKAVSA